MWEAVHYVNGVRQLLAMNHGADDLESGASAVHVDGTTEYVAGYEAFYDNGSTIKISPRLWKDGVIQPLQSHEGDGRSEYCFATSVKVRGANVYVGGYTNEYDGYPRAVLWRNGEEHEIVNMPGYSGYDGWEVIDFGVAASGDIIALVNNVEYGWWGIYPFSVWRVSADLNTWTEIFVMDPSEWGATMYSEVAHIFVDGDDWYIAGYIDDDGRYWKNGLTMVTMDHPAGVAYTEVEDIFVLDGEVFATGVAGTTDWPSDNGNHRVIQWKNGEVITDGAIAAQFPGGSNYYTYSRPRGLHVK
jgi:hypothetical protein